MKSITIRVGEVNFYTSLYVVNAKFNIKQQLNISNLRYRGNGIYKQECGMTIDQPTNVDRSEWKCYVGYSDNGKLGTLGAILDASDTTPEPEDGMYI